MHTVRNPNIRHLLAWSLERSRLTVRAYAEHLLLRSERTVYRWLAGDTPIPSLIARRLSREWGDAGSPTITLTTLPDAYPDEPPTPPTP